VVRDLPCEALRPILFTCIVLLVVLFYSGKTSADACSAATPMIVGVKMGGGEWSCNEDYSDEFSDSSLDVGKWISDVKSWGEWSWDAANVNIRNGVLRLRMSYDPHEKNGRLLFYRSGIVKSRAAPIKYGFFEARLQAAGRFPGVASAFWMYKALPDEWTEIDIVELLQSSQSTNVIDHVLHTFRIPGRDPEHIVFEGSWVAPWNPADSFHTYGLWWRENIIRWYVDGQLMQERINLYWHQPLDIVLSIGIRAPLAKNPSRTGFPTEMNVDYIRVWREK
jgi:beta-glucanase (GH16 family)